MVYYHESFKSTWSVVLVSIFIKLWNNKLLPVASRALFKKPISFLGPSSDLPAQYHEDPFSSVSSLKNLVVKRTRWCLLYGKRYKQGDSKNKLIFFAVFGAVYFRIYLESFMVFVIYEPWALNLEKNQAPDSTIRNDRSGTKIQDSYLLPSAESCPLLDSQWSVQ